MEQQIVMRLLFVDQPIPSVLVESWMSAQSQKCDKIAVVLLDRLMSGRTYENFISCLFIFCHYLVTLLGKRFKV